MDYYAAFDDSTFAGGMDAQPYCEIQQTQPSPPQQSQQQQYRYAAQQQAAQQQQQPPPQQRPAYVQQQQPPAAAYAPPPAKSASFVDRMFLKRKEFVKLLILALLVVLALSLHGIIKYAFHMTKDRFSTNQVLSLKVVYALVTMLVIWILKTINTSTEVVY